MRITVLGCWAPYPRSGGACSGYVLQDGGARVLLDLGHGCFSRLSELFNPLDLKAVILSHLHPDHCGDLPCLRHALRAAKTLGKLSEEEKLPLYLPKEPTLEAQIIAGYTDSFAVHFIEDLPRTIVPPGVEVYKLDLGAVQYYLLPVQHKLSAYAVAVEGSGYLVYSGDSCRTEELVKLIDKADIFLCEASGQDGDEAAMAGNHLTARQAGEMAQEGRVKELILTHFFPEYDLENLRQQAEAGYGARVELAVEGDTYFV
ncbi:MAG: MBL fold metallo-hydrolase, partial [Clostridia bacterium]|nr:MBL fold metallo-hydrolase [Clostridia bacterium]